MAKKDLKAAAQQASEFIGLQKKAENTTAKQFITKTFKKPNSDYYRLDLVIRDTVANGKTKPRMIEAIKTDYKTYLTVMARAEDISITKYLHKLIDEDMKKNEKRYSELKELFKI